VDALAALPDADEIVARLESAVRLAQLQEALDGLEQVLAGGVSAEAFYQRWIEEHCWIFGNAYAMRDSVRTNRNRTTTGRRHRRADRGAWPAMATRRQQGYGAIRRPGGYKVRVVDRYWQV
jgi:hypothetical protein